MLGVVSAIALSQTPEQESFVVDVLIRRAVERNRGLAALRQRIAEALGLQRQAGVKPVPTLEFSSSTGRPLATKGEEEYSAGYFFPVETAGKRQKRVRVADKEVQLAETELAERIRQLAFEIQGRFVDGVAEQQKVEALDRLIDVNRQVFRLTQARVEKGDAAPLERDLLSVELSRAEALRASSFGRLMGAVSDLKRLAAVDGPGAVRPRDFPAAPLGTLEIAGLEQHALKTRPDLLIARLLEEQGSATVDLAEAEGKPNVTLSARYARRHSRFDDQFGLTPSGVLTALRDRDDLVTVGVSIPLLNRNRNLGNIQAAEARLAGARLRRLYLEAAIPLEVMAAWDRYMAARRALDVYDRGVVEQSEKNLNVIRQAYSLGQLRILDVLNEQRRLVETYLAVIDARAEGARALAELVRAVGGTLP
ncbi:MAG: TolC family protein [Candidatus Solibacter usitatus]|nr:TolC family protein [Candidatus Solibacter usitatus]